MLAQRGRGNELNTELGARYSTRWPRSGCPIRTAPGDSATGIREVSDLLRAVQQRRSEPESGVSARPTDCAVSSQRSINYHPQSGWFDEGPSKGPPPCGRGLKPPEVLLLLVFFLFLLVADVVPNNGLV